MKQETGPESLACLLVRLWSGEDASQYPAQQHHIDMKPSSPTSPSKYSGSNHNFLRCTSLLFLNHCHIMAPPKLPLIALAVAATGLVQGYQIDQSCASKFVSCQIQSSFAQNMTDPVIAASEHMQWVQDQFECAFATAQKAIDFINISPAPNDLPKLYTDLFGQPQRSLRGEEWVKARFAGDIPPAFPGPRWRGLLSMKTYQGNQNGNPPPNDVVGRIPISLIHILACSIPYSHTDSHN